MAYAGHRGSDWPRVHPASGPNAEAVIRPGIRIGSLTAEASIQTSLNSDRVIAVTIEAAGLNTSPSRRAGAYDELKRLLIEKYGAPKDEQTHRGTNPGDTVHLALWTFPGTSITLTWSETTPRYGLGYVTIRYQQVDKKALDIL